MPQYCSKDEYKRIYLNRKAIQLKFINKVFSSNPSNFNIRDFSEFVISLMCEFANSPIKYYELPSFKLEAIMANSAYFVDLYNEIALSTSYFEFLKNPKIAPAVFLKVTETVGHEMTHFKQFYGLLQRLSKDHNLDVEADLFLDGEDELFDEWSLKALRATLPSQAYKKTRNVDYKRLEQVINYNLYYFRLCEKQARNGGRAFLNKMINEWEKLPIEQTKSWTQTLKLYSKKYYEKQDKQKLENEIKIERAITKEFLKLVPEYEKLKKENDTVKFRRYLMNKSIKNIQNMTKRELICSYWGAVKDGNDVMIPYLIDTMAEKLPQKNVEKIMNKTLKYICRSSSLSNEEKSLAYSNIVLNWTGFNTDEIAYFLYKAFDNNDLRCVFHYFKECANKKLTKEVAMKLATLIIPTLNEIVSTYSQLTSNFEELLMKKEADFEQVSDYRKEMKFTLQVCNEILMCLEPNSADARIIEKRMNELFKQANSMDKKMRSYYQYSQEETKEAE